MSSELAALAAQTGEIYERNAERFDRERPRIFFEQPWIDRFASALPAGGRVLDLGCGAGEPIAGALIDAGFALTGFDIAPAMLALARRRFPGAGWVQGDMRTLALGGTFDGIIGWDSFFHLTQDEQRATLPRIARHLAPGGVLLLTVGPEAGEVTGHVGDDRVFHASLAEAEYRTILGASGITITAFVREDPGCDYHSLLLARKDA